jgi:hypothetical protein
MHRGGRFQANRLNALKRTGPVGKRQAHFAAQAGRNRARLPKRRHDDAFPIKQPGRVAGRRRSRQVQQLSIMPRK